MHVYADIYGKWAQSVLGLTSLLLPHFLCHSLPLSHTHIPLVTPSHSCQLKAHLSVWFNLDPPYWWLNGCFIKRKTRKRTFGPARGCSVPRGEKRVWQRGKNRLWGLLLGCWWCNFPWGVDLPSVSRTHRIWPNGETEIKNDMGEVGGLSEPSTQDPGFLSCFM